MDKLNLETLADRVVAWHNRHPLARRIAAAQLQSVGYVALPFRTGTTQPDATPAAVAAPPPASPDVAAEAPPGGGSLRERAMARARQGGAAAPPSAPAAPPPPAVPTAAATGPDEAAFAEDFLAPLRRARVARWALQHAPELGAEPRDAPVRRADAQGAGSVRQLYALTALIEVDGQRSRVLVGTGEPAPVLGQRLWSRPRLGAAAGLAVGLPALGVAALLLLGGTGQDTAPTAAAARSAASAARVAVSASAAQPGAPAGVVVPALRPQLAPAAAPASAPPAAAPDYLTADGRPVDVEPQLGRIDLPGLGLPRGERPAPPRPPAAVSPPTPAAALAAVPAPAAALPAPPQAAAPPAEPPARAPEPAAPAPPPAATAAAPPVPAAAAGLTPQPGSFAVSTRLLRTRAESEQVMQAMQALLEGMGAREARVDIVPHGDDWRVIGWPFARRQDADRARALLASRGMRVEVLVF